MSFLRPEAMQAINRWSGALFAGAVLALGLWWGLTSLGLIKWIGWLLALGGAALLWASAQRARFRGGHGGLGVVEVDERQIAYLAPVGGGIVSLDSLSEVAITVDRAGLPVWRFTAGAEVLRVPTSAEGTEALFDALTALPGVDIEAAIRASRNRLPDTTVIWRKPVPALH
jgi:hypothetical protein